MSLVAKNTGNIGRGWLVAIILVAALVRIFYLIQFSELPSWSHLTVDNNYHINWAANIAGGNLLGDTTYFRAPLYVFVLAALIKLGSVSLWVFRIFGLLVGIGTTYLVYRTSLHLSGIRAARVAALLFALCPIAIYFESEILLDSFFTFLLLLAAFLTLRAAERKSWWQLFLSGVVWGLAAITRPTVLILMPIAVWIVLRKNKPQFRTPAGRVLVLLLGTLMILATTFARNLYVADDPVLVASQGGVNLYIGNNPEADGVTAKLEEPLGQNWRIGDITHVAEEELGWDLKPGEVSSFWTARAFSWIAAHPGQAATLTFKKLGYFFSNREISNNRDLDAHFYQFPYLWYNPLTFGFFLVLAAIGLAAERPRDRQMHVMGAAVMLYALAVAVFFVSSRFRLPIVPFLIIMGASLFSLSWSEIRRKMVWVVAAAAIAAVVSFVKLVEFPPGSPVMETISRGLSQYSRGDYRESLNIFLDGRRIDSTFPEINLNCGAAYLKLGQTDSARYYFELETKLHPQRHAAYTNLASLGLLNKDYSLASRNVSTALQLKPYDIDANLLAIRIASVDTNRSLPATIARAAKRTDNNLEVMLEAGRAYVELRNFSSAEPLLLAATRSHPPPIETDDYAFDNNFRNSARNRRPLLAEAHYLFGYCLSQDGNFPQAVKETELAIQLDSTLIEAHVNLIAGYLSLGQVYEADSILKLSHRRFGDNPLLEQFDRFNRIERLEP